MAKLTEESISNISDRAKQAARHGNDGYFTTSLIRVAEHDVPALIGELTRLRGIIETAMKDKTGRMERVYEILESA